MLSNKSARLLFSLLIEEQQHDIRTIREIQAAMTDVLRHSACTGAITTTAIGQAAVSHDGDTCPIHES